MRFGTIGADAVAQAIGRHLVAAGYPVTLSGTAARWPGLTGRVAGRRLIRGTRRSPA
jgi:hypothetical protein